MDKGVAYKMPGEISRYKPEEIIIGYCRVYNEWITLDKIFVLRDPLNDSENKLIK